MVFIGSSQKQEKTFSLVVGWRPGLEKWEMERGGTFLDGVVINVQGREAGHQLRGSNGS